MKNKEWKRVQDILIVKHTDKSITHGVFERARALLRDAASLQKQGANKAATEKLEDAKDLLNI